MSSVASEQLGGTAPAITGADLATIPNLLSVGRVIGVSVAVLAYFAGYPWVTIVLGTVACLTDHLDGYFARRLKQETTLGAMLDQAADSYTAAIALAMLVVAGGFPFAFLMVFLAREFWVATVRRYAALRRIEIPSHLVGKMATAVIYWSMLVMAIAIMLDVPPQYVAWMKPLAVGGLAVGLALSCLSGWRYTQVLTGRLA